MPYEKRPRPHGNAEHLVQMANDIGNFFRSEPERKDGIAGIANHIAKFWTPRMRQKLLDHVKEHGDAALDELPREALEIARVTIGRRTSARAPRRRRLAPSDRGPATSGRRRRARRASVLGEGFHVRHGAAPESA
jgi:formate dehydrogenase subunit delta